MEPDQIDMMSESELRRELRDTVKRMLQLERTFKHMHVNAQDGTDFCGKCGLDLRDGVHTRVQL